MIINSCVVLQLLRLGVFLNTLAKHLKNDEPHFLAFNATGTTEAVGSSVHVGKRDCRESYTNAALGWVHRDDDQFSVCLLLLCLTKEEMNKIKKKKKKKKFCTFFGLGSDLQFGRPGDLCLGLIHDLKQSHEAQSAIMQQADAFTAAAGQWFTSLTKVSKPSHLSVSILVLCAFQQQCSVLCRPSIYYFLMLAPSFWRKEAPQALFFLTPGVGSTFPDDLVLVDFSTCGRSQCLITRDSGLSTRG